MCVIGVDESVMNELLGASSRSIKDKDLIPRSKVTASFANCFPVLWLEICRKL